MLRFAKILFLGVTAALLGALVIVPALAAQEGGQGGIIIEANSNGDIKTMNPLLVNDVYSANVIDLMFPTLVGVEPKSGVYAPGAPGSMAKSWKVSDDGKTYTFTLRDDLKWTDGTVVTSADWLYAYKAVASGKTKSPRSYAAAVIDSVEAPDATTLVIHFKSGACNNIDNATAIRPVPSAAFTTAIGEDYAKMDEMDFNKNPSVSAGRFKFSEFRAGEQVSMEANLDYPDTIKGYVNPQGYIYKTVPDANVAVQQFLAGEVNVVGQDVVPPQQFSDLRTRATNGEIQVYENLDLGYEWMALNAADPTNPQNGLDKDGKPIDQGHHPMFGDVRVRNALAMAIDTDAIIKGALFGEGVPVASPGTPASWAYDPSIKPPAYNPDAAKKMLADAGWIDQNGDGILEAHGAPYAKDGTPFHFVLLSDASSPVTVAVGTLIQDQLKKVGVDVDFQAINFNTAVEKLLGQTYDAIILGWKLSFPDDPDFKFAFAAENDQVGGGFNFVSYNNPDVVKLLDQANNLPGCDQTARAKLYNQAQALLAKDNPYIFLYTQKHLWLAGKGVDGFAPYPQQMQWNVDSWAIAP